MEAGHEGMTMNPTMSCLVGARAPQATSTSADYVDPQGRKMTGHWIVPPGKQVNHSDITWFMNLPFDTRLHYAAEQGCELALMGALPGSGSQRNAERHGFRVAYTRIKWRLTT